MDNPNLTAALAFLALHPEARLYPAKWNTSKGQHKGLVRWRKDKAATNDPETLKAWAEKWPTAHFCVDLHESGLTVLDPDRKKGKDGVETLRTLELLYGQLPRSLSVATPSNGRHIVFKGNGLATGANRLGEGLDIPIMVPVPGSHVEGKGDYIVDHWPDEIATLPDWIRDEAKVSMDRNPQSEIPLVDYDLDPNIERAIDYLKTAPPAIEGSGGDQHTLQVAMRLRDLGISEPTALDLMLEHWNDGCQPPWTPEELETKVSNAFRYAKERPGNDSPTGVFAQAEPLPDGPMSAQEVFERVYLGRDDFGKAPNMDDLPDGAVPLVLTAELFLNCRPPDLKSLLHPVITEKSYGLLYAARGVGKSWFALSTAVAIAGGTQFGPWEVPMEEPSPVLYWDGELTHQDVADRIQLLAQGNKKALKNLHVLSSDYIYRLQKDLNRPDLRPPALTKEWFPTIEKMLELLKIRMFIVDNLSCLLASGLSENDKEGWAHVNQFFIRLRCKGVSILMLHHTGKSGDQRGFSGREDNVDYSIKLDKPEGYLETDGARFTVNWKKKRLKNEYIYAIRPIEMKWTDDGWEIGDSSTLEHDLLKARVRRPDAPLKSIIEEIFQRPSTKGDYKTIKKLHQNGEAKGWYTAEQKGATTVYTPTETGVAVADIENDD